MKIIGQITQSAMRNRQIVVTLIVTLILFGVVALQVMPRQEFPEFHVRQGLVVGVYPGATSEQVEEQLTSKVEDFLFSYKEIDREETYSYSQEGMMYIFVEVRPEVKNTEEFWSSLKHGLAQLKSTLPPEVLAVVANNKFADASALLLTIHSEERSYKELEKYLDRIESELRKLPSVSAIQKSGLQQEEINIYLDSEKLALYNINPLTLLSILKAEESVTYAGDIDNGTLAMPIHLPARYNTESDLARQIIYTDPRGVSVRLGDVAEVKREYKEPDSYVQIDGNNCIILSLEMMYGNNIVTFGEEVNAIIDEVSREFPPDVQINTIADMPHVVKESVNVFMHEFLIAVLAVIAVTMILLPFRISSVAATTIPIAIMITLGALYVIGIDLDTVSLAALILVLGMVVDNTIVVVDNYVDKLDDGVDPWTASWKSVQELFVPVLTATLAIISVFIPMNMFLIGVAGDFVGPLPATISITLGVSLLVTIFLVPVMTFTLIKTGLKNRGEEESKKKESLLGKMQRYFDRLLGLAFRHKGVVLLIALALIILTGVVGSRISSQFGPVMDRDQFAVEIFLPTGSSLDQSAAAADDLQEYLLKDPRVEHVTAFIGTSSPRFHTMYAPQMPGENFAQLVVNTTTAQAASDLVDENFDSYQSPVPQAVCSWKQIIMTNAKAPLEVRLYGDNIASLKQVGEKVETLMRETEGTHWVRSDFLEPMQSIRLNVQEDEANRLGMAKGIIGYTMAAGLQGIPLATVWEGDYPVSINLRQSSSDVHDMDDLNNLTLSSPFTQASIRARQLVNAVPEWSEGRIIHRSGERCLTVQADVKRDVSAYNVFKEFFPKIEGMEIPNDVRLEWGGDHQMEVKYYTPFVYSLLTSIVIIFFIMLFEFKSVRTTFIIMSIVPLSAFGMLIGLLIAGYPFGMTAFIGVIGLVGMVMRNGIIYMDYAERMRLENGMSLEEAAFAAGKRRMRPIFLTAMAAAVGVIPMIASRSPIWGPMGTVICFGLLFTMLITLVVLPVLYSVFGPKKRSKKLGANPAVVSVIALFLFLIPGAGRLSAQEVLTLEKSKQLALENNVDVLNASEELKAAKHQRSEAFASWFPNVSAMAVGIYPTDPLVDTSMEGGDLPVYDGDPANLPNATEYAYFPGLTLKAGDEIYTASVTATQPIFAGGRIYNGNRLAKVGVESRAIMKTLTEEEVLVGTEQRYWQIVSLEEKIKTVEAYREMLLDLEKQVSDAWNSGLILQNDLLKVQLKLSEVNLNRSKLRNGHRIAMMAFCQYIGISYDSTLTLDAKMDSVGDLLAAPVDHRAALEARGEHRLLQNSVKAAKLQQSMAMGEHLPSVAVGYSEYYFKMDDQDAMDNGIAFVTVSLPISEWWGGSHKVARQKNQLRIRENEQSNTDRLLLVQMDQSWNELEEARDQHSMSLLAQQQAQANLDVNQDSYDNGVATLSDLLEAQALLQEANDRLTEARIGLRLKELSYLKATNRLR